MMAATRKYGRIRNARQNAAPVRAFLLIALFAMLMKWSLAGSVHDIQTISCEGARNYLAGAEQNYYRRYHRFVVGDEDALQELARVHMIRAVPECRAGGHYTASVNPDGSITVRCSLADHDQEHGVTRKPWQRRK